MKITKNKNLKDYNTYKLNTICKTFIEIDAEEELIKLINNIKEPYKIIGNGSNLILPEYINGIIIHLNLKDIYIKNNEITASSGILLPNLVNKTINNNLTGLEWASGIPASLGGAIMNNAGAYKHSILDFITKIKVLENNQIKEITEYLTYGSNKKDYLSDGFKPVIPKGTKLLYFKIDDDLLTLNFSKKLLTITEEEEKKLISSLVYTYTSIDGINKITIYVEGNLLDRLPNSNEKIPQIIDKSYGINQIYNITDINGTTKTTIYYLSKYKDYYYYVPVTLINNDKSDKVEIILSELASKSVYETSLISYLKDVREISYEMENDFISLNMSKKLFNDLYESNLIEKVIYTINLSIKNNYEHKKVIYYIDNELYETYDF